MKIGRKKQEPVFSGYDYSTPEARERTASELFSRAKNARTLVESEWKTYNDYYNFIHKIHGEVSEWAQENELDLTACMPDPWVMVESQIDPSVPEPEFRGRDDDMDSKKARQREYAVRYICENNRLKDMNTRNERRLLKLGDAFWKAYWDTEMRCGIDEGDIRIKDIPVDAIFPDPAIRDGTIQDGEYLDYVYSIHKVKFCRRFKRDLEKRGLSPEDLISRDYMDRLGLFDMTTAINDTDDTVQVLEHWYRQPEDTKDERGNPVPAGAVACSIQVGGRELRNIPNYWEKTCRQNTLFPFVHYWRVQDENRFWNKSELFPILDLVDAADRKLATGILNDEMMANDIILLEDGAMAEGEEPTNEPGSVWRMKQGRMGGAARLGGIQSIANAAVGIDWLRGQMERANRNYDTNQGKETSRVTTATGMALLRQDASDQADIKKADRNAGFERLYELLDWLVLEFFDDGRMLFLGADPTSGRRAWNQSFNSDDFAEIMPALVDENGETVRESWTYYPKVDVTITAGDSIVKGKQATLNALQALAAAQVTESNWKILAAELEILDIPNKQEIVEDWQERFALGQASAGGAAGPMQETGIPGAQTLPLLGGAPV